MKGVVGEDKQKYNISNMLTWASQERIEQELHKCVLLCEACEQKKSKLEIAAALMSHQQ